MTAFLSSAAVLACGLGGAPASTDEEPGRVSLEEIVKEPERYVGRVVRVAGTFQGWQTGPCRFAPAASRSVTRSDWLIRTDDECLYVTGGLPDELDPTDPADLGRRIELTAEVVRGDEGKVLLVHRDSRPLERSKPPPGPDK